MILPDVTSELYNSPAVIDCIGIDGVSVTGMEGVVVGTTGKEGVVVGTTGKAGGTTGKEGLVGIEVDGGLTEDVGCTSTGG